MRPAPVVPGDTGVSVRSVSIVAAPGSGLDVNYKPLKDTLGLRAGSLIRPERKWNPFRLAEDGRRIRAHAQLFGHFEAEVSEPAIARSDAGVDVTWTIAEGPEYRIGSVDVVGAPAGTEPLLREMISFGPGAAVDLTIYRPLRRELAERLQLEGFGHAQVYSRAWLDRSKKTVSWVYFVDAGPQTTIGSIEVIGNHRVPAAEIVERSGMNVGDSYSTRLKQRAELALLDGGSIRSIVVRNDADILAGPPEWPDTGGAPAVDDNGDLVPRQLDPAINLKLVVVEAPRRELRLEAGAEADPARLDAFGGARVLLRDLAAARNHIVLEGSVGYGWDIGEPDDPTGLYGAALIRYVRASALSRRIDLRLSGRLTQALFPGASVREISAGPGLRSVLADNLYLDLDVLFARARELDFGPFDMATRAEFSLADDAVSSGGRLETALVYDARDDRIEPMRGHLLAVRLEVSPGGSISTHRYARVGADGRLFVPLATSLSLGLRGAASVVAASTDDGVPLGARAFGGGSFGFRGFGRQRLAPAAGEEVVGGLSLVESSIEGRFLPFRGLYGAIAFFDLGAAGADTNPFEDGVSGALGLGVRARSFWVPLAIDVAYRLLEDSELVGPGDIDRWALFFRIGEAF